MKSKLSVIVVLVAFAFALLRPAGVGAATTLNVNVGGGANSIAANGFFPKSVTIHQGDTIHFANSYAEPHTTTYVPAGTAIPMLVVPGPSGPPQLIFSPQAANPTFTGTGAATFDATKYYNSGLMLKDASASVTFPNAGTFKFICLFHAGMSLAVNVVAASATADTQTAVDTRAQSELTAGVAAGEAAASTVVPAGTLVLADGTSTYRAVAGGETAAGAAVDADVMRFFPKNINIKTGDSVEWSNSLDVPHTVTFGAGTTIPPLVNPLPQPSGPPLLMLNPAVFAPAGGTTYDGTGSLNTGALGTGFVATSATIKFTTPGTYTYVCLIHADQNMTGTITVTGAAAGAVATPAAPTGVTAPNTGTGPDAGAGYVNWTSVLLLLAAAGGTLVLVGAGALRRRT